MTEMKKQQSLVTLAKEEKCPFCASSKTEHDKPEFDKGLGWLEGRCKSCGSKWLEHYKVYEIEEL